MKYLDNEIVKPFVGIGQIKLDFELAKIYGYETKRFNEQVKNNINKFPERYRFQLSKEETILIQGSKNLTAQIWATNKGGRTSLPYAFTEQGIYINDSFKRQSSN